ncbi:hypothetical protein [Lacinutrix mariniflava]|uniref:hypothetical protein n=1 Tax=Lacinutrix mariniflava TaxID=342955 RepID=UPI000B13B516|nr:hypothetical protein [Lacinutrix mariniflava]
MIQKLQKIINNHPLRVLLTFAVFVRVCIALFYNSISIFPDSQDYINLGELITRLQLENYPGNRTPGYSTLIALANNSLIITVIFQILLGFLNIYLLFDFSKRRTKSIATAFWITFFTTSFIHYIFFEFAILTESLTISLVLLIFWFIERFKLFNSAVSIKYYFILSILLSIIYLIKPLFIYFTLAFALFYFVKNYKQKLTKIVLKSSAVILLPFLIYFSWNSFNKKNIGYFTNTFYFGINLSQTATSFFEKAPDEDALIRDILVRKRDSLITFAPRKIPMSVWFAYDELKEKSGLTPQNLSAELGRISKNLFKKHPDLYAKQVLKSSYLFFTKSGALKWNYQSFKNKYFKYGLVIIWEYFQIYLLALFNILFILFAIKKLFQFFKSKIKIYDFNLFVVCIVLSGALAQGLVVYGSNSRFAFPFLPLIVYFVIINVLDLKSKYFSIKKL